MVNFFKKLYGPKDTRVNIIILLLLILSIPITITLSKKIQIFQGKAASTTTPMPIVSYGLPAYGSANGYPPSYADSTNYAQQWRANILPGYVSYDLSRIPPANRNKVVVAWYNDTTWPYDVSAINAVPYNIPQDYTIQANSAPGGGAAPTSGWVTIVNESGNKKHSRSYQVDLTGYNWITMNVTGSYGSTENNDAAFKLEIFDASQSNNDSYIFYGDFNTTSAMGHVPINNTLSFSQLIHTANPLYSPLEENGGEGFSWQGIWGTSDAVKYIPAWLPQSVEKYVGLNFGTVDADNCVDPNLFYNNYVTLVQTVLNAGRIPIIPHFTYGKTANIIKCGPGLIAKLDQLYANFPQIIRGPDFWGYFQNNPKLISGDGMALTNAGNAAYRTQMANQMLANVYTVNPSPTPTAMPIPTNTPVPSNTPTPTVINQPTATPTPKAAMPTPTTTPSSANSLILYDNAISSSFTDNSFGYNTITSCDTNQFVSAPCSYGVTLTGWGGLNFIVKGSALDTSKYQTIEFNLFPNGQPISDFSILFLNSSGGWVNEVVLTNTNITGSPKAGWDHIAMPISVINISNVLIGAIQLKNAINKTLLPVNYDDIQLVGSGGSIPTATPTLPVGITNTPTPIQKPLQTPTPSLGQPTPTPTFFPSPPPASLPAMQLISLNVPAFAPTSQTAPANANNGKYGNQFRMNVPGYLAYDLSSVPSGHRTNVVVAYYNDPMSYQYDPTVTNDISYNNLSDYTIDVNSAPGGGNAPSSGWVSLVTVSGNRLHSRQHVINMTGYNWVRINVTKSDGSTQNFDAAFSMDIHDASQGVFDDWIFYGASIDANIMHHNAINTTGNFSQLINSVNHAYYPLAENGGIGGTTTDDAVAHISNWLSLFPGKFVDLSYGTNDANGCMDPAHFKQNLTFLVQNIELTGKTAIIPHIPWAPSGNVQNCGPKLNTAIDQMYAADPQIIKGPDLWATFFNQSNLFQDNLHPNTQGEIIYRNAWKDAMIKVIYNNTGGGLLTPTPTVTPTPLPNSAPTPTPTNIPPNQTGLLPGDKLWKNNVPSYLFGTNDSEDYSNDNFNTDPYHIIQPSLKNAGLSIMRVFIFHYSLADNHRVTLGTNPQIQLNPNNPHEFDSPGPVVTNVTPNGGYELEARLQAIQNSGMQCLIVLPHIRTDSTDNVDPNTSHIRIIDPNTGQLETDLDFAKRVVAYIGNRCSPIYEIGNEEDLDEYTDSGLVIPHMNVTQYLQKWQEFTTALRQINPNAKFIGPVTYNDQGNDCWYGSQNGPKPFPSTQPGDCYMQNFMHGIKTLGYTMPDAISFHWYPCDNATDGFNGSGNCGPAQAASYADVTKEVKGWIQQDLGINVPLYITEWNFDPGSNTTLGSNSTFMSQFTTQSLNAMINAGLDGAFQFDAQDYGGYGALDMFDLGNKDQPKAQFTSIANIITQYKQ